MTAIIDTNCDVTDQLPALQAAGITTIGRYLDRLGPEEEKVIKPAEARAMAVAGLRLFLIFEIGGRPSGSAQGHLDGRWSAKYLPTIGAPAGAAIYYAVDYDAQRDDMPGILAAFATFHAAVVAAGYRAGVYGSGDVCTAVIAGGSATLSMLSCSVDWSGSEAYAASGQWALLQHPPRPLCGIDCDTDVANGDFGDFVPFAAPLAATNPNSVPAGRGWLAWLKQKFRGI
jgi:Rv2525c-like, glycoside hydrolase-like domain